MQVFLGLAHDALQARRYDVATTNADAARELAHVHGTAYERSFAEWTAMLIEEGRDPTVGSVARATPPAWPGNAGTSGSADLLRLARRSTANASRASTKVWSAARWRTR